MKKRALTLVLALVLALGTVVPAMAYNGYENGNENGYYYNNGYNGYDNGNYNNGYPSNGYENGYNNEYYNLPSLPPAFGKVGYITKYEGNQLTIADQLDKENIMVLNLNEATIIIDAHTGEPATIADRETDRVKIYHAVFTTMSIPPQSPALVVAINLPDYSASPFYHVIEELEWKDDDTLLITVDNGGLIITLDRETPLNPHLTRQMIELEHLQVGDTLLFWYGMALGASYPANTTAERAIWLSAGEFEYAPKNGYEEPYVYPNGNGDIAVYPPFNIAEPGKGTIHDGVEFFPVRALASEAGFNVTWRSATSTAELTSNGVTVLLANKATTFYVNGESHPLAAAVFIKDGVMYAPYGFFAYLR